MYPGSTVTFSIVHDDILKVQADVVALKYAQSFFGADAAVAEALQKAGIPEDQLHPAVNDHILVNSRNCIRAPQVLFVGVPPLLQFGYQQIRQFSAKVLEILVLEAPNTRHLAMTIHGANYGLDEIECAQQQLNGLRDALRKGHYPSNLQSISIVEKVDYRVELLAEFFEQQLSIDPRHISQVIHTPLEWTKKKNTWPIQVPFKPHEPRTIKVPRGGTPIVIGEDTDVERMPHVFVAMPFAKDMRDIWEFGIYRPVRKVGLLCERMDEEIFTGGILEQIKKRIDIADLVIADITGANANVFLEVGYAWGKNRPTILLCKEAPKKKKEVPLPFDVRGQRCLVYEDVVDLEEKLIRELKGLNFVK